MPEDSSKEIQSLKENISEIMSFLKNERENVSDNSGIIENSGISGTKKGTDNVGTVSIANPCVPPKVMTSTSKCIVKNSPTSVVKRTLEEAKSEEMTHSTSDLTTVNNHNIVNLDISAVQSPMVDQAQDSSTPAVDQTQISGMESNKEQDISLEEDTISPALNLQLQALDPLKKKIPVPNPSRKCSSEEALTLSRMSQAEALTLSRIS